MTPRLPEEQIHALIAEERWRQVADELADVAEPAAQRLRKLARNVGSIQEHRADLYTQLLAAPMPSEGREMPSETEQTLLQSFIDLREPWQNGQAVAVLGIGDGSKLLQLSHHGPELMHKRQQPIFVIEPDAASLWHALAAQDLSGPAGPIEQRRVQWYAGPNWCDALLHDLQHTPTLPFPFAQICGTVQPTELAGDLERVLRAYLAIDQRNQSHIGDHYAQYERSELLDLLGPNPQRKPRALFLTSRFTSVLQYSARDSADGFAALGWETLVAIEPQPWHTMSRGAIHEAIARFKPDLVFQIDHLRHEQGDAMPQQIPFVCWIQDHLPNLTNDIAGRSVSSTEFVMSATPSVYVDRHGYAKDQIVAIHKLTRVPSRPANWTSDGEDVVFVSTASRSADQIIEQNLQTFATFGGNVGEADVFRRAQMKLVRVYATGNSLQLAAELGELIDETSGGGLSPKSREAMLRLMVHPLNDSLYRQQALEWLVQIARESGLNLGLYGRGWEQNPTFAPFARGWVQYGEDLEALTRRSKINLQITPNACLHQRLLDGLVAGGFFLIRHHVTDDMLPELAAFVREHLPDSVDRLQTARAVIAPPVRDRFERLIRRAQRQMSVLGEEIDPVAQIRAAIEAQTFDPHGQLLPRLGEVMFNSKESLQRRIERFLNNESDRADVAEAQRRSIEERRTYVAGVKQLLSTIRERMAREAQHEAELRHRDAQSNRRVA